ncbi:MAG: hydrogenase maturation protease [Candidatus Sumerlaeota bacterium]|nr:hydrogenase maturation protease [Candidatus Sumerlaeota bacterium]
MSEGARNNVRVAIVGLGNELLMDDGIGIHAIRLLQESPPEGVTLEEVGTSALYALDLLESADEVIAIDAVQAGGTPGTIYRFDSGQAHESAQSASLHDLGIVAALRMLPEGKRPRVTILGVEPKRVDYGMELTPEVKAALPAVVEAAREIAREKKSGPR